MWNFCSWFFRPFKMGAVFSLYGFLLLAVGCGGGSTSSSQAPNPTPNPTVGDFSLTLSPSALMLSQGTTQGVTVQLGATNGFSGSVAITATGLPSGVSVAPLSIDVAGGSGMGTLQFSASDSAVMANATATVKGSSGTLSHTAALTLGTRSSAANDPFVTLGGGVLRGYFDTQRQLLFTSNYFLNEVDVVSASGLTVTKRISIPRPVGIDQMPDGKTLVVGTFTQGIYLIDEDTGEAKVAFAKNTNPLYLLPIAPLIPAAMANGKVLFIGKQLGTQATGYYLGGGIFEWDPASNSFVVAPVAMSPTGPPETEHLSRSGDHKFAIFDQYGGGVFLYNSDTDSFDSLQTGLFTGDVAGNPDGTQFAESINGAVRFYDRNLNLLATVNLPLRSGAPELAEFYGMQYSPDGSQLYVQATDLTLSPVVAIDAKQYTSLGMVSTYFDVAINTAYLVAADESRGVFVAAKGGVGRIDCSHPASSLSVHQILALASEPDSAPLNTPATASFQGFGITSGTTVKVGGVPGSIKSNDGSTLVVNMPASSIAGPADVVFTLPDGTVFVLPQDFSYGATASAISATLAPEQTAVPISLYGFGLLPDNQAPSVSFGGLPATAIDASGYSVTNTLEKIGLATPVASQGTVDVSVNNANGSSSLHQALTYLHTTVVPAAAGLSSLLFDSRRNLLYATRTNGTEVAVFDPVSLQWKASLSIPGAMPGASYDYFALTSDGSKLVCVDSVNAVVTVFDPDNPSSGQSESLRNASVPNAPPPSLVPFINANYVATTTTGKAFINILGWNPAELDLATMTFKFRNDIGNLLSCAIFRNSLDRSNFIGGCAENSGGFVAIWDSATDSFHSGGFQEFWGDFAISNNGKTIAATAIDQQGPDDVSYFIDSQLDFVNEAVYPDMAPPQTRAVPGVQLSPHGTVFVIPREDSIEFVDVATGKLRARYITPEPIVTPQNVADIKGSMTFDDQGQTVYVISASGLTVIQLPVPMDNLPQPVWPFVRIPKASVSATKTGNLLQIRN